jgi:hypothetical protein
MRIVFAAVVAVAAPAPVVAQHPPTSWDLYSSTGGRICRMTFGNESGWAGNKVQGCPEPYTHWRVEDDELRIFDGSRSLTIRFRRTAEARYDGTGLNRARGQVFVLQRSHGAGADPNAPATPGGAPQPPPVPQMPAVPAAISAVAGSWTIAKQGGFGTCRIELHPVPDAFGGYAATRASGGICESHEIFHLRQWNVVGNDVVLINAFNETIVRLRMAGPAVLRGGGFVMQR